MIACSGSGGGVSSGGSGTSSGGGGGGATCNAYVDAIIAYAERCGSGFGPSPNARARFLLACERGLAAPGAGNIDAAVASCSQKLSTLACGSSEEGCVAATGTLADGTACAEDFQCASGACKVPREATCGTCGPKGALGDECTSNGVCPDGALCFPQEDGKSKCVPRKAAKVGEACEPSTQQYVECDAGLYCDFGEKEPTCKPLGTAGASCVGGGQCSEGLRCIAEKCATGLAEGATCKSYAECASGLGCDPSTKKCIKPVFVKAGAPCDSAHRCERGRCRGSKTVNGVDEPGTCVDPLADGAPCIDDGESPPCDDLARCVGGKCVFADPAQCK